MTSSVMRETTARSGSHLSGALPRTRTCDQGTPRAARRLTRRRKPAAPPHRRPGPTFRCYVTTAAPPPPGHPVTGPPGTNPRPSTPQLADHPSVLSGTDPAREGLPGLTTGDDTSGYPAPIRHGKHSGVEP
jgi:hypothetical protein